MAVPSGCVYARISTQKQRPHLHEQIQRLQRSHPSYRVVSDVASGLNFKRRGLRTLLRLSRTGDLPVVVVTHRDRLCCLAYDLLEYMFEQNNTRIEVLFRDQHVSADRERAEDVLSMVTVFGARRYGARPGEGRRRRPRGPPVLEHMGGGGERGLSNTRGVQAGHEPPSPSPTARAPPQPIQCVC